jgi:hypothetical protein
VLLNTVVDQLQDAAPWLNLGDAEQVCRHRDHALDAMVAALLTRAAALPPQRTTQQPAQKAGSPFPVGLEYRVPGLTWVFSGARFRSCCDLILAGKSVEDGSAANLVVGEVDHWWGLGLGLGRGELAECAVWSHGVEMVEVDREDPA